MRAVLMLPERACQLGECGTQLAIRQLELIDRIDEEPSWLIGIGEPVIELLRHPLVHREVGPHAFAIQRLDRDEKCNLAVRVYPPRLRLHFAGLASPSLRQDDHTFALQEFIPSRPDLAFMEAPESKTGRIFALVLSEIAKAPVELDECFALCHCDGTLASTLSDASPKQIYSQP